MSYERIVELKRWPGIGFGFSVIGGSDTHIPPMICALVRDSPALLSQKVYVGDLLYKVNGVNVTSLETKQVVDLIRNCKKSIVLSLKEDRLAKLKARPFLAEDTLIDPPRSSGTSSSSSSSGSGHRLHPQYQHSHPSRQKDSRINQRTRTVGSPRSYEHGADGSYNYRSSKIPHHEDLNTQSSFSSSGYPYAGSREQFHQAIHTKQKSTSSTDSRNSHSSLTNKKSQNSNTRLGSPSTAHPSLTNRKSQHSNTKLSSPPTETTIHMYTHEDVPRSPRYYTSQSPPEQTSTTADPSYKSLANSRVSEEYVSYKFGKSDYMNVQGGLSGTPVQQHRTPNYKQLKKGKKYNSFDRLDLQASTTSDNYVGKSQKSAPPYKSEGNFDFKDGCAMSSFSQNTETSNSYHKNRPQSNPEIDVDYQRGTNEASTSLLHAPPITKSQQNGNYSSPNIYDNSEHNMYREHKALTLTPATHSVYSLSKPENKDVYDKEESFLSPLSVTSTHSSSAVSSSISPASSVRTESEYSAGSHAKEGEEVSPADIASRLFTLNGYKDTDVAPLLGKNSDYSQQICREYLRFFQFEGISLDDALRSFLQKFPLTGETQERERILIHFSNRYHECNRITDMDADSVHTLTCAMMLLNTDLHGQSISNKMTLNDFVNNLSGLNNGKDFSKENLKTLYNAIKSKEIIFARAQTDFQASPKPRRKNSAPGNPFLELKVDARDAVVYEGLIYRKSVMDTGGRRTPLMRRNWRPFYCILKGLVLLNYKPDNMTSAEPQSVGIHHALAGYAKDYKKRMFVFKLIAADWSVYYIQVKNQEEVKSWMDSVNVSAALLSSPPLPAPCGSSIRFQRPVMPVSRTRLSPEEQLKQHSERVEKIEEDLAEHLEFRPDPHNKNYQDWDNKNDYLGFELKRFKAYSSVLATPKLDHIRDKIIVNSNLRNKDSPSKSANNGANGDLSRFDMPRSSSMHSLSTTLDTSDRHTNHYEENRLSYSLAPP